jgi:uncharacterized membrane protein YhiD involved in acid resistance
MPPDQYLPGTPLHVFLLNFAVAGLLSFLLGLAYVRFGHSLSNRKAFARNFLMLTLTTTLIISIVKSSLALSLGLVGALSIVRFRAAIKEPEELAYLFLAISLGLGLGASQTAVTVIAFAAIVLLLALRHLIHRRPDQPSLFLTVSSAGPAKLGATQILAALRQAGADGQVTRFDETPESIEVSLVVAFKDIAKLEDFNQRLRALQPGVRLSYLEDRSLSA